MVCYLMSADVFVACARFHRNASPQMHDVLGIRSPSVSHRTRSHLVSRQNVKVVQGAQLQSACASGLASASVKDRVARASKLPTATHGYNEMAMQKSKIPTARHNREVFEPFYVFAK